MHIATQLQVVSETRLKSISSRQHNEQGGKMSLKLFLHQTSEELQIFFLLKAQKEA